MPKDTVKPHPWADLPYPGRKRPGPNSTTEEYVEGHWIRACEVSCGWGHLHRSEQDAERCANRYEGFAAKNGWVKANA